MILAKSVISIMLYRICLFEESWYLHKCMLYTYACGTYTRLFSFHFHPNVKTAEYQGTPDATSSTSPWEKKAWSSPAVGKLMWVVSNKYSKPSMVQCILSLQLVHWSKSKSEEASRLQNKTCIKSSSIHSPTILSFASKHKSLIFCVWTKHTL